MYSASLHSIYIFHSISLSNWFLDFFKHWNIKKEIIYSVPQSGLSLMINSENSFHVYFNYHSIVILCAPKFWCVFDFLSLELFTTTDGFSTIFCDFINKGDDIVVVMKLFVKWFDRPQHLRTKKWPCHWLCGIYRFSF